MKKTTKRPASKAGKKKAKAVGWAIRSRDGEIYCIRISVSNLPGRISPHDSIVKVRIEEI